MKMSNTRFTVTVVAISMVVLGSIAYTFDFLDVFIEPKPKAGDIWVPRWVHAQPYWPDFWDTRVLDVRDGCVLTERHTIQHVYSTWEFHRMHNFARTPGPQ